MAILDHVAIPAPLTPVHAARLLVLRNFIVYKSAWKLFLTGFLEPVLYLFSIGIGVGQLIDAFEFHGEQVPYAAFVAPAMLATSAFNGALLDSTFNVFFKLKYEKLYDQMLATPLTTGDIARGEIAWGLIRGSVYSAAFLVVMLAMGLVDSWWAVLALPAAILDRLRVLGRLHGADDVDEELAGLRQDHARADAALPLLGDVLPGRGVRRRRAALGRRGHPALPRRRAVPRAHHRRRDVGVGGLGRLPRRDGRRRPARRTPSPRQRCC